MAVCEADGELQLSNGLILLPCGEEIHPPHGVKVRHIRIGGKARRQNLIRRLP